MPRKQVKVAIAVVFDAERRNLLICKRKADVVLGGYWEFPGGKCQVDEEPAACALREVREETGLIVRSVCALATLDHEYPHARVLLHPFVCEVVGGELKLLDVAEARWVTPAALTEYRFPEANGPLLAAIAAGTWGAQSATWNIGG